MARPSIAGLADIVSLPVRFAGSTAADSVRTVRNWSVKDVDDWGRDPDFAARLYTASSLRWDIAVGGADLLPPRAGALIAVNARRYALAPVFAALALSNETGRPVRFVGRPDIAPLGPLMQRMGGLLPIAAELEGALRAGQLVVLGSSPAATNASSGSFDHQLVGAAVAARVRVFPAAALSAPGRREARVEIAKPVRSTPIRRGPLAEYDLSHAVQRKVDELLVEFGGPLSWGLGG